MSDQPTTKEKTLFLLNTLIALVESDQLAVNELQGKTVSEMLDMAQAKADEAATAAGNLKTL